MWGSFEILESYVGERVNKIRFVGNIKRGKLGQNVSTYVLVRKGEKPDKREETRRAAIFCNFKVRVSLTLQSY